MRGTFCLAVVLSAAVVGTTGCSGDKAQNQAAPPAGTVGTSGESHDVSAGDRDFVKDTAIANMAEIDVAKTALNRGRDANVKKFAQMMADDHTKALTRLQALATQHHIEVPAQVDDEHREKAEKLSRAQGAEFDRDYADAMVDGHQGVVDKLESRIDKETLAKWKSTNIEPASGKKMEAKGEAVTVLPEKSDNPVTFALNQWAAETYPVAFAHLQAAKDLQKGLKRRTTTP